MVQGYRNGQEHGQPLGPFQTAEEAIGVGNGLLVESQAIHEVTVHHRLCTGKAHLSFSNPIPEEDIAYEAAKLEQSAMKAMAL